MLFKLSNLNSNLALTLGYLNPASNNLGQLDSRHQVYWPALFVTHIVLSHSTVCTSLVGFIHTSYKRNKQNRIEKKHIWNTFINHGCQYTVLIFWLVSLTMYHVVIVGIVPCSSNDRPLWVNTVAIIAQYRKILKISFSVYKPLQI